MKTYSQHALDRAAAGISAAVLGATIWLFANTHGAQWPYAIVVALLVMMWLVRLRYRGTAADDAALGARQHAIGEAMVLAGVMLLIALGAVVLKHAAGPGAQSAEFATRAFGLSIGIMVAFFGNAVPKRVSSRRGLVMRRGIGWAMVLGGVGYALAWLVLPLSYAENVALLLLLCGLAVAVARAAWYHLGSDAAPPPTA